MGAPLRRRPPQMALQQPVNLLLQPPLEPTMMAPEPLAQPMPWARRRADWEPPPEGLGMGVVQVLTLGLIPEAMVKMAEPLPEELQAPC